MSFKKILFSTDFSPASQQALSVATSIARDSGATLLICHVSQLEPYPVGEHADSGPPSSPAELDELRSVRPIDSQVKHEHHLLFGEAGSADVTKPADVIIKFAKENNVDAIILGTHGRSGIGKLLMGSVAQSVVGNAECPVITVRQPKRS